MINHVVFNHLDWASNCGEDYFPLKRKSDGRCIPYVFLPYKLEDPDKERFESVVKKITDNMNVAEMQVGFNLNIKDEVMTKILECIKLKQVATIWGPPSQTTTSVVKIE